MNKSIFSFLLTLLAGLSTMIGYLIIYIKKDNHDKIIASSLAFASGVMISTSILDLIPESIKLLSENVSRTSTILLCFLGLFLGIIISMIINYYIPDTPKINSNKSLYRIGLISMIAIIMHNIPEGIATFMASSSNTSLGISLTLAIAMHNIPEGISISVPIYYSTENKKTAFIYTLISALSEPFGAILAIIFLKNIMTNTILAIIFSLIGGIMLEISLRVLLPNTKKYHSRKRTIIFFIIGILFMCLKYLKKY